MEGRFCRGKTKEWNLQNSFLPILAFPSSPLFWRKTTIPSFTDFPIIFPLSSGLTFNSCIYCDTNTAFAIFLPCLAPSIPHSTPKKKQQSMSFPNLPRLLASLVPAVPHSQVTIPSHPAQTPRRREESSVSGFQYRYRNIGGCQIHIEHCYEEISRPTSRTHRQYSFPNECNMNRQICLFLFFHIFFFINNGATLPLRSQPWRRVTDFSDLFNFLSLLLSFLCFWLFHFPFFTISSVFFCVLFLINIFPFELLYK